MTALRAAGAQPPRPLRLVHAELAAEAVAALLLHESGIPQPRVLRLALLLHMRRPPLQRLTRPLLHLAHTLLRLVRNA